MIFEHSKNARKKIISEYNTNRIKNIRTLELIT